MNMSDNLNLIPYNYFNLWGKNTLKRVQKDQDHPNSVPIWFNILHSVNLFNTKFFSSTLALFNMSHFCCDWLAGNGRCTRNIMRTSLWSKTISYARHTHAESHASFHAYVHPHIVLVVPQVPNLHSLWPRPQNFYTHGYICMLAYTKHFPLRPTPVPAQILTESKLGQAIDD